MKINTIAIPSFNAAGKPNPNLTLIHGWAAESRVWESWVQEYFSPHYSIILVDLPGCGESDEITNNSNLLEDWLLAIEKVIPEKTHLLGWSLGGLIAQQIALRNPDKIQSLICLASTPRFTQNDGWKKSVSPKIINDFIQAVSIEAGKTLKQFWRLQLQGVSNSRSLMKSLVEHMSQRSVPSLKTLNQGLRLLKDMDNRQAIKNLNMPTLWLLGEHDPLIPQDIRESLPKLQPQAHIEVLADGSHIPFFSKPQETAQAILDFLRQQATPPMPPQENP